MAIKRPRIGLIAILAVMVAVILVACADDADTPTATTSAPAATEAPTATTVPEPTATAAAIEPEIEQVSISTNAAYGDILVGADNLTLYIFDRDSEGVSNCSGGCLDNWPPLLTENGAVAVGDVTASIGTIDVGDGKQQVTVNGFPAYYWKGDAAEGDTAGNGVGSVWWVFNADGSPQRPAKVGVSENSSLGTILVDGAGMSLYLFDNDTEGVSNCSGGCLNNWPPLLTEYGTAALADVTAELGTITRDDGAMQVTVNGMPAYFWANDAAAGDAGGQSLGGAWWVFDAAGEAKRY